MYMRGIKRRQEEERGRGKAYLPGVSVWHDWSYHQIPNDHDHHEDDETHCLPRHFHAVPHGFDPFAAKHSEHNQEGVEEIVHVPPRQLTVNWDLADTLTVAPSKQLHSHHSEDEDDDGQDEG